MGDGDSPIAPVIEQIAPALASRSGPRARRRRFNFENNWWVEPTVGSSWTYTFEDMGISNEEIFRVQGGIRAGTSVMWGNMKVEPRLATGSARERPTAREQRRIEAC
jgi:hypothetical protein